MTTHGAMWHEDEGGERSAEAYISFPSAGLVYQSTKRVMPWVRGRIAGADPQSADDRWMVPAVYVEAMFGEAPVPDPDCLEDKPVMTFGLSLDAYMSDALELIIQKHVFEEEDGEGNKSSHRPRRPIGLKV